MTRAERLATPEAPETPGLPQLTPPAWAVRRVTELGRWRIEHITGTGRWAAWLRPPAGGVRYYTEAPTWRSCAHHAQRVHHALTTVELLRGHR